MLMISMVAAFGQISPVSYKKDTIQGAISLSVRNELPAPIKLLMSSEKFEVKIDTLLLPSTDYFPLLSVSLDLLEQDSISLGSYLTGKVIIGDPLAIHDGNVRYLLPFKKGYKYELIQGFGGRFSHSLEHSKYALDFAMNEGQEVRASRSGIVCYYEEHFSDGGADRELYMDKGNRLMILHEDGTIGVYNHLLKNGVLVELGQRIQPGELIAYSGNTGFSTRPHLHFVVRAGNKSVPISFVKVKAFKKGKRYGY